MGCALSLSKSVDSQQQRRGRNKESHPKNPYPTEDESLFRAQRVRDRYSELCDRDDRIALARLNAQRARRDEAELVDSVASSPLSHPLPLPLPHPRHATGALGRSAVMLGGVSTAGTTTPARSSAAASPTLVASALSTPQRSMTQPASETTEGSDAEHSLWHHQRSETTYTTPETLSGDSVGPFYAPAVHVARPTRKPACVFDLLQSHIVEDDSDDDDEGTTTISTHPECLALPRSETPPPSSTPATASAASYAYRRQPNALESLRRKLMPLQFFAGSAALTLS
uniref:Uncharacterized protein n=1 Tax=Neobodo designis TaxID=312471 RepID=A0A7S1QSL9_NEODS|eukprot:CAMPEP_0174854006 /NCGR_PEP_ID=MMETSP1114-20130205/29685_1 /TAXON_ID=312471 /ORGANISM="Neobodo designis, Strain CCAP 1951/1" /LENGTH=283 /DNA_ID=CAMNT_0016088677 /DNA_START=112 /DNA_END=963 /DNA_ORIENTATION=-